MIDPLTALSVASTARPDAITAGASKDTTADVHLAPGPTSTKQSGRRKSELHRFSGSSKSVPQTPLQRKRRLRLARRNQHDPSGMPSGLREYKDILRKMRKAKEEGDVRKPGSSRRCWSGSSGSWSQCLASYHGGLFYFIG